MAEAGNSFWYDYPITQEHDTDDGVDVGTPDNTALSFPEGGQVIDASYHVYGGQVVVHLPEGYDEYWIHLNKIFVSPGEYVSPDEIIGTSGGGVGGLILKDGHVQPATSQSDYKGHSSGYHSELGYFQDRTAQGSMAEFNKGWGNKLRQLDPRPVMQKIAAAHPQLFYGAGDASQGQTPSAGTQTQTNGLRNPFNIDIGAGLADAGNRLLNSMGFDDAKNALLRRGAGGVGVVLMLGSLVIALQPEAEAAGQGVQKIYEQAQGQAAKAVKAVATA